MKISRYKKKKKIRSVYTFSVLIDNQLFNIFIFEKRGIGLRNVKL